MGMSARDYYLNPEKALEAGLWALALHKYGASPAYNIPDWAGWDFGGEMVFPTNPKISLPYLRRKAVNTPADADTFSPWHLNSCKILVNLAGVPVYLGNRIVVNCMNLA